jgi:hypothetical protein
MRSKLEVISPNPFPPEHSFGPKVGWIEARIPQSPVRPLTFFAQWTHEGIVMEICESGDWESFQELILERFKKEPNWKATITLMAWA